MKNITATWGLNPKAATTALRAIWIGFTGAAITLLYTFLSTKEESKIHSIYLVVTIIAYIVACIFLRRVYSLKNSLPYAISVREGTLFIPRSILSDHHINLSEIKSIEKFDNSKEDLGVLIGRSKKSSIFLEKKLFISTNDFEDFTSLVNHVVVKNLSENKDWQSFGQGLKNARGQNYLSAFVALLFLTIYLIFASEGSLTISQEALAKGALTKDLIKENEFYRFASSFFLHYNPYHLLFNILSIAVIGRYIDVILGRYRFATILLASAFAGALTSLIFSKFTLVIGASGGIFGLFGAYFVISLIHQDRLAGSVSISSRFIILALLAQALFDLIIPEIDFASHVGGFLFGCLYGVFVLHWARITGKPVSSKPESIVAFIFSGFFFAGFLQFVICFST
jgi:membrane associated rhomboid family serine protease